MGLDSGLLRTFLAVLDAGSVSAGAARIHRSQSAASTQIKQLEAEIGRPLFRRHGRGVVPTPAGSGLEPVARQVVEALDAALAGLRSDGLSGALRVGVPDTWVGAELSAVLAAFGRAHPKVELTVRCALSGRFADELRRGELDLAVHEVDRIQPGMTRLRSHRLHWVAGSDGAASRRDPLPVAVFDRSCWWRDVATVSLRDAGRAHRIVFSSETLAGVAAAVEAGMAVGVLDEASIGPRMRPLTSDMGFPSLPESHLVLEAAGPRTPIREAMAEAIVATFGDGSAVAGAGAGPALRASGFRTPGGDRLPPAEDGGP